MNLLEAFALAFIQGLTEFLPVSSSGHLAIASKLMNIPDGGLAFDIVLHLGTLFAVFAFYWKDIVSMLKGIATGDGTSTRLAATIVLGTIPVAVVGLFFGDFVEGLFSNMLFVSSALAFTGLVLFFSGRVEQRLDHSTGFTVKRGLLVGLAQAAAIFPGVSRSGTTISAGLFVGLSREESARFSFLLAIPAVLGAAVKELPSATWDISVACIVTGFLVSATVGFGALALLVKFVKRGKLGGFAWYCWGIALAGFAYFFFA